MTKRKPARWTIDAVLRALISDEEAERLAVVAEEQQAGLRGDILDARLPAWDHMPLHFDRRDGRRRILTPRTILAPGIHYRSDNDRSLSNAGMGSDDTGETRVRFEPCLTLEGRLLTEAIVQALPGTHAGGVVDHHSLAHPGLLIDRAGHNSRDGEPTGTYMLLPVVTVPLTR